MTKREREQLIELLRCGADEWHVHGAGVGTAAIGLGVYSRLVQFAAAHIWERTSLRLQDTQGLAGWNYADVCLEAAVAVEEGEWG